MLAVAGIAIFSSACNANHPPKEPAKAEIEAAPGPPLKELLHDAEQLWREGKTVQSRQKIDEAITFYPQAELWSAPPPLPEYLRGTRVEVISLCTRADRHGKDMHELLDQARRIAVSLQRDDLIAKTDYRIADAWVKENRVAEGAARFEATIERAKKLSDLRLLAISLVGLSVARIHQDRLDETIALCNEVTEILKKVPNPSTSARNENNLGWSYLQLGKGSEALAHLKTSASQYRNLPGGAQAEVGVLQNLAAYYVRLGDFAEAQNVLDRGVEASVNLEDDDRAPVMTDRAEVAMMRHQFALAQDSITKARDFSKSKGRGASHDDAHIRLVEAMLADATENPVAEGGFREVANAAYARSDMRLEAAGQRARWLVRHNRLDDAEAQYSAAEDLLDGMRNHLNQDSSKLSFFDDLTLYDEHVDLLVSRRKNDQALIAADRSRARLLLDHRSKNGQPSLNLATLRSKLKSVDGIALFYWIGTKHGYLWIVDPSEVKRVDLAGTPDEIQKRVAEYFTAVSKPGQLTEATRKTGRWLREVLLDPAESYLAKRGGQRPVFIVLDDKIGFNPESLPGAHSEWWIDEAVVSVVPSLALLERPRDAVKPTWKLLAIGDALASEDFEKLEHAKQELDAIAKQFPAEQIKVFRREQATPSRYQTSIPIQFEMIHFTAHGKAEAGNPLDSAVVLSKDSGTQSAKLYARTIVEVPIHARLVTISACKSAGARTYRGEGAVGLAWAFLGAGAHQVVAGLWNVNDETTRDLMSKFYEEMVTNKQPPAAALRKAKKFVMESDGKPYYWAPFVIFADSVESVPLR